MKTDISQRIMRKKKSKARNNFYQERRETNFGSQKSPLKKRRKRRERNKGRKDKGKGIGTMSILQIKKGFLEKLLKQVELNRTL